MRTVRKFTIRHPEATTSEIKDEIERGIAYLNTTDAEAVAFFGSQSEAKTSQYSKECKEIIKLNGKNGIGVVTPGVSGLTDTAQSFAKRQNLLALTIHAGLHNRHINTNLRRQSGSMHFQYLFVRRLLLSLSAKAFIFFPGGHGVTNELMEHLTFFQNHIAPTKPIILYDENYWKDLFMRLQEYPSARTFFDNGKRDLRNVFYFNTPKEASSFITSLS